MFLRTASLSWAEFWHIATDARVLAALRLSFGAAFGAAIVNLVMGTLVAWVLVRYDFPFKRVLDAVVDLPFALPTAVAGISLAAIYAPNGLVGQFLAPLGIKVAFTPLGVLVALTFVSLPFVVRTVQPVIQDLNLDVEEAPRPWAPPGCRRSPASCCRPWLRPCSPGPPWRSPGRWASTAR